MRPLLLAVDVGTLSARAGLFDATGRLQALASAPLRLRRPAEHRAVYRMAEIWRAVAKACRACLAERPGSAARVAGLAFDATSSLALTAQGAPALEEGSDVFCWMDHRSEAEAARIDAGQHGALRYVGGSISPESHLPKLLWLKRHDPDAWSRVVAMRDLCDELAFRATGVDAHSLCGLACKWLYLPHASGWDEAFLAAIGLQDLTRHGALRQAPRAVGAVHGPLAPDAARQLGLPRGIPVAVGLIDAEAGTLGALGRSARSDLQGTASLIGGTSTCLMTFAPSDRAVPGVWGPFRDAVFPGLWLHESGQSLSGAALDAVLAHHPAGPGRVSPEGHAAVSVEILRCLDGEGPGFAANRHLVPDWLGNRSPLGDGSVRALATGLGEETTHRALLEAYFATARGLALQARQIVAHLNAHGYAIGRVTLSGGHRRNPLMVRLYRDALGVALVLGDGPEPVLLGTAMVAACAAGLQPDLFSAVEAMAQDQHAPPPDAEWQAAHAVAYETYLDLYEARNRVERQARRLRAWPRPGDGIKPPG